MPIRVVIAVVPAIILAGAILVAWAYPLTRPRHQEIQAELAQRRAVRERGITAGESQVQAIVSK